jgi:transglutaminase-like putative cysteine protease
MPNEATFRFSTYLTLALACITLGYAQREMLPEVVLFALFAIIAFAILYFLETRVTLLSIPAANRLGLGVGLVYLVWVGYRVNREIETHEFASIGWHMLIVAMCGPLMMLVLAAKVARGEKHAGDFWTLHGSALACVGLAAAFSEEPVCFVLVGLYLVCAVWSLTLFYLARSAGHVAPIPQPGVLPPLTNATASAPLGSRTDFRPAIVWTVVSGMVAVPVFLLTPRSSAIKADFGKPKMEIGYGADQMVNLNRTGPLKTNDEPAFNVTATQQDGITPKLDLNTEQRWRGRTHFQYLAGEWTKEESPLPLLLTTARETRDWVPPFLGENQFTLTISIPPKLSSLFLADPVQWRINQPPPIASISPTGPRSWLPSPTGTFYWEPSQTQRDRPNRYLQIYRVMSDPDLSPGFEIADAILDQSLSQLRNNSVPRVKEFADQLLDDLITKGELPKEWKESNELRHPVTRMQREIHHERIARAFTKHLTTNRTLRYTTELKRENTKVDPVEDFLFHTKAGHCERFATALVLMLRSQGIPALYVRGFKGCEHQGDGRYVVKQEHAHAWVECLVALPVPEAERRPNRPTWRYHWLSLDPTPVGGETEPKSDLPWWKQANNWIGSQFKQYVADYTPEQRGKAIRGFFQSLMQVETLGGILALIMSGVGLRYALKRARKPATLAIPEFRTQWFGELVTLLAAHGIRAQLGETVREFAKSAAVALQSRASCATFANMPVVWTEAYYRERFGDVALTELELTERKTELELLRKALQS